MNDNLKGTLTSIGCAASVVAPVVVSLADPDLTINGTTLKVTMTGFDGLTTTGNSTENTDINEDTTSTALAVAAVGAISVPVVVAVFETKNNVEYDLIEKRANKIYDKYHKNHIPSDKRGKGFIFADNPDTAYICNEMFYKTFVSQESLIVNIKSLLSVISDIIDNEMLSIEEKEKLQKAKEVLIELNAAYTEKKVITLSTKDDETLQFILNNFKKHQENNKSKIRTLSERKK